MGGFIQGIGQARLLKMNARVAGKQAEFAEARGAEDARQIRQMGRLIAGSQRAGFAGQGVDVGTGSALAIQEETAYLAELDANTALHNAALKAWGFEVESESLSFQSKLAKIKAFTSLAQSAATTGQTFGGGAA